MPVIEIFCDGSCQGTSGGWGAVLRFGRHEKEFSGSIPDATSNIAEMTAFLEAFKKIKNRKHEIHVYTDSQYLQKGITIWSRKWQRNGWKTASGSPVKNQELWKQIIMISDGCKIHWHWIRGHAGHPQNERADKLAFLAANKRAERLRPPQNREGAKQ